MLQGFFFTLGESCPIINPASSNVCFSPGHYILLDCGESSLTQILDHFGADEATKILTEIDMVFISHLHPDHHLVWIHFYILFIVLHHLFQGLFDLVLERQKAFDTLGLPYKPLVLLTAQIFEHWVSLVEESFGLPLKKLMR
jgi:ribonuclease Z